MHFLLRDLRSKRGKHGREGICFEKKTNQEQIRPAGRRIVDC